MSDRENAAKPSALAVACVLDNARGWARGRARGLPVTLDTRLAELSEELAGPTGWKLLLVGAGLDEFVEWRVERAPTTVGDVARAYDVWAGVAAAAGVEGAPSPAAPDLVDQLRVRERERERPRMSGAQRGVWDRSSPSMAVCWCSSGGDVGAVVRAVGGHHAPAKLATLVLGALEEPPASPLLERARWPIVRAQDAALAALGPDFVAHASMVCVATGGTRAAVAHVGDARALLVRGEHAEWLTCDHTLGGDGPHAGRLTRAIGIRGSFAVEVRELERRAGEVLLLCSRDVARRLTTEELAGFVAAHGSAAARAITTELARRDPTGTAAVVLVPGGG